MVVAPRAGHRQAHECSRRRVDLLVHHVVDHLHAVLLGKGLRAEREKTGGNDSTLTFGGTGRAASGLRQAVP